MAEATWAEMKLIAKGAGLSFLVDILDYRAGNVDHGFLCDAIDKAIDQCAIEMARFPKELDPQTEDQLTVSLILQLQKFGFSADHDATSGGHCDIVIKDNDNFLWLGEAKKVSGHNSSWIGDGFDQLSVRYDTGQPAQDRGCLIIFCNCERIDGILSSWKEFLIKNFSNVSVIAEDKINITFVSKHAAVKTGRAYHVRHKPISVYFAPLHGKTSMRSGPRIRSV